MIDLVKTHLTHPWGPPWTLETLGGPWRPLATCLKMTILGGPHETQRHGWLRGLSSIQKMCIVGHPIQHSTLVTFSTTTETDISHSLLGFLRTVVTFI